MLNQDFSNTLALINTNQITHCHFEMIVGYFTDLLPVAIETKDIMNQSNSKAYLIKSYN